VQSGQDCELKLEERRERDTTGREGGRESTQYGGRFVQNTKGRIG